MYVLITYDVNTSSINGQSRLRKVAKCCLNYGQRVQNSVFECFITESQLIELKANLQSIINTSNDSIRIYKLGKNPSYKIECIGVNTAYNPEGELII